MPANRRLPHHLFLEYYYFNKNISSFSLFSRSLSPSLSSHFFLFSSFSLILTFVFSLLFVSTATTLKATVATSLFLLFSIKDYALLYTGLLLMNHLNSSPNQTKTKTQSQSERQNRSERRERGRCSQPHTTRRRRQSVAHNPQPVCYHGP